MPDTTARNEGDARTRACYVRCASSGTDAEEESGLWSSHFVLMIITRSSINLFGTFPRMTSSGHDNNNPMRFTSWQQQPITMTHIRTLSKKTTKTGSRSRML